MVPCPPQHEPISHSNPKGEPAVYSLLFHILDGVRQRLVPGFRKEWNNKASEDGADSIDDPG